MAYNPKKNIKFLANKPVYSETKSPVETNMLNLDTNIGKEIVELQKRHYGTKDASRVLDRSFIELTRTKDSLTPENYNELCNERTSRLSRLKVFADDFKDNINYALGYQ